MHTVLPCAGWGQPGAGAEKAQTAPIHLKPDSARVNVNIVNPFNAKRRHQEKQANLHALHALCIRMGLPLEQDCVTGAKKPSILSGVLGLRYQGHWLHPWQQCRGLCSSQGFSVQSALTTES